MSTALSIIVGISAIFGTGEAIRQTQSKARRDEHRSRKTNLAIRCSKSSQYSPLLEGRRIVLSGCKLYVDTGTDYDTTFGHPFAGYFLPYPETRFSGLISSISDDPSPMMNWIYVDRDTHELKFGTRPYSEHNFKGPFDCTRTDRRLTFGGWEGFCVVLEGDYWALYFDVDDDGLKSKVKEGTPVLEVELLRKEIRGEAKNTPVGTSEPVQAAQPVGTPQEAEILPEKLVSD